MGNHSVTKYYHMFRRRMLDPTKKVHDHEKYLTDAQVRRVKLISFFGSLNVLLIETPLHPTSSIYVENTHQTDGSNDYFVIILTSTSHSLGDLIDAGNIFPDTSRS